MGPTDKDRLIAKLVRERNELQKKCSDADEAFPTLVLVETVRAAARKCGWAIGVHGSLARDIDLIAVPWVDEAADAKSLIVAIKFATGYMRPGLMGKRPHNRHSILLIAQEAVSDQELFNEGKADKVHPKGIWYPPAIDLSIVDRRLADVGNI